MADPQVTERQIAAFRERNHNDLADDAQSLLERWEATSAELAQAKAEIERLKMPDDRFAHELEEARRRNDMASFAHVVSGRLRQMDKRAREANKRADALEALVENPSLHLLLISEREKDHKHIDELAARATAAEAALATETERCAVHLERRANWLVVDADDDAERRVARAFAAELRYCAAAIRAGKDGANG